MRSELPPLETMIAGSKQLHEAIMSELGVHRLAPGERNDLAATLAGLSAEHGQSILALIERHQPSSALALVRVQFETLVRAFWMKFAASDERIAKLVEPLPQDATKEPDIFPAVSDMMTQLSGKAPQTVLDTLSAYKELAWGAMNSYTHGSLRPIFGFRNGYAPQLLSQVLQNSNGSIMLAGMLVAQLIEDEEKIYGVLNLTRLHAVVLPPLQANVGVSAP